MWGAPRGPGVAPVTRLSAPGAAPQTEPVPGETVERPEPGLARGRWEAPGWFFYAVAVAALVSAVAWIATALRARRRGAPR